jgi:hypothetical protein
MGEFVFRNLSVKLVPELEEKFGPGCPRCSVVVSIPCGQCSQLISIPTGCLRCSQFVSIPCGPCSQLVTFPTDCGWCSQQISCPGGSIRCPGISCGGGSRLDIFEEIAVNPAQDLGALKQQLQGALAEVEAQEAALASAAKPKSVEEIDELKKQLLAAVEELDEQRAAFEG